MSHALVRRSVISVLLALTVVAGALVVMWSHTAAARIVTTPQCADPFSATRDPTNPLMLTTAPGANPLSGAPFNVDGPTHGPAAGAIARLLGIGTNVKVGSPISSFPATETWTQFDAFVQQQLPTHQSVANSINLLAKIASEPHAQRVSSYVEGGGPGAIYSQTQKLFCDNFQDDPGTIPQISTYFMHPEMGGCPTKAKIFADRPTFERHVTELAKAIENRPVVLLLETDAIGSSKCMSKIGSLGQWLTDLRFEVDAMAALPHSVVYVEAGYSDGNSAKYTARALNKVDITKIRGFWTNDTHNNWTINEVKWGDEISKMTHGAHFVINTATNGQGPKLNPHPSQQGNEQLCNPPGRGLGPQPTTATGFPQVDAFLWTFEPGNSGGHCAGGPAAGTFWAARGIDLASRANGGLGPGYPSTPY